jgi:hypothetical protein
MSSMNTNGSTFMKSFATTGTQMKQMVQLLKSCGG